MPNQVQNISFMGGDYNSDLAEIERRKKLAEALQAQSMEQSPTQVINGWAVPQSPLIHLSKIAQALGGAKVQSDAKDQEKALSQRYQDDLQATLRDSMMARQGSPGSPMPAEELGGGPAQPPQAPNDQLANALLMRHPATQGMGLQGMQQDMQRQAFMGMVPPAQPAPAANPMAPGPNASIMAGSGAVTPPPAPPPAARSATFGAPAGGLPMAAWLRIDPTGKSYAEALAKEQITPHQQAQLDQGERHFTGVSGNTAATLSESMRHNRQTEGQAGATQTETARHHKALEGDPAMIESTAQAIASGKLAPLSGFALSRPSAQATMSRVVEINPDFDPTRFATVQKAEKDFATGKQGNSVRSFNVALSHLETLDQLSDALNNKDLQAVNKLGNAIASQTGKPAPTEFNAAKKIVADEIVKAIVGSGGGVADREEAAKTIDAANSPAQLKGVIKTYKELMRGQIGGLRDQYKSSTGKDDFDTKFLSESARKEAHVPNAPVATAQPKVVNWSDLPGGR